MVSLIRKAKSGDFEAICAVDEIAKRSALRRDRIREGISESEISVVSNRGLITGYVLLSSRFFGHGFLELVFIHPRYQGRGLGPMLIKHVESICLDSKLFTTTNESNLRMQGVLERLGYSKSGIIYNLDPGDPELLYFKDLSAA